MVLPDTFTAHRQVATLRFRKYHDTAAQRGLWRRKRLFFQEPRSTILVQWRALRGRLSARPEDGRIKGREVRLISVVVFQRLTLRSREVHLSSSPRDFAFSAIISVC